MSDGVDERLPPDLVEAMVVRRAHVVVEAARADAEAGRILIRRPESGAVLDRRDGCTSGAGKGEGLPVPGPFVLSDEGKTPCVASCGRSSAGVTTTPGSTPS